MEEMEEKEIEMTISDVATYFVYLNTYEEEDEMTRDRLQYLLYIAQRVFVSNLRRTLFDDTFVVSPEGPKNETIDHTYDVKITERPAISPVLTEKQLLVLYRIDESYKNLSDDALRQIVISNDHYQKAVEQGKTMITFAN